MKIVFISNFFNHHQKAVSDALYILTNKNYLFIETEPMSLERQKMGWALNDYPDYVLKYQENISSYASIIDNADIAIIGSAPASFIKNRLKKRLPTFTYRERIYKNKYERYKWLYRLIVFHFRFERHKNYHLLCASAYAAADYARSGSFIGRAYKWGYFPKTKRYCDARLLAENKKTNSLLWVGRFIGSKHPETTVFVADRLKKDGYNFEFNIIGAGELEDYLREQVKLAGLTDCVHLLGAMSPENVREYMEHSQIFIFTSDRGEGWGAVLNEAMNSCCAVVASHAAGSVPFLMKDGHNGFIYLDGEPDDLYRKVKLLICDKPKCIQFGLNAYKTITDEWNAEIAAAKLIRLSECLMGKSKADVFEDGICSKAEVLKDNWFNCRKNL